MRNKGGGQNRNRGAFVFSKKKLQLTGLSQMGLVFFCHCAPGQGPARNVPKSSWTRGGQVGAPCSTDSGATGFSGHA